MILFRSGSTECMPRTVYADFASSYERLTFCPSLHLSFPRTIPALLTSLAQSRHRRICGSPFFVPAWIDDDWYIAALANLMGCGPLCMDNCSRQTTTKQNQSVFFSAIDMYVRVVNPTGSREKVFRDGKLQTDGCL
jgi:hypothetical protein